MLKQLNEVRGNVIHDTDQHHLCFLSGKIDDVREKKLLKLCLNRKINKRTGTL